MISIIICSLHEKITESLVNNIESTIGIEHEIIFINNKKNQFSIFQAYNIGVSKAKYPICCFMHDDIIYHSNNWGYILSLYFQTNVNLGIIAVAGCKYLRKMPSFWAISKYNAFNIVQSDKKNHSTTKVWNNLSKPENIIAFDGMWFCTRKSLFDIVKFDEKTFNGFHFYDLDIAMQTHIAGFQIQAVPDILIEHTSLGNINNEWLKNALLFYTKWHTHLPVSFIIEDQKVLDKLEDIAIISFLRSIKNENKYKLIISWAKTAIEVKGNILRFLITLIQFGITLLIKKTRK
jgi:hypothetical protein